MARRTGTLAIPGSKIERSGENRSEASRASRRTAGADAKRGPAVQCRIGTRVAAGLKSVASFAPLNRYAVLSPKGTGWWIVRLRPAPIPEAWVILEAIETEVAQLNLPWFA